MPLSRAKCCRSIRTCCGGAKGILGASRSGMAICCRPTRRSPFFISDPARDVMSLAALRMISQHLIAHLLRLLQLVVGDRLVYRVRCRTGPEAAEVC